jgi:membrane-associated phospholipid phosphatase
MDISCRNTPREWLRLTVIAVGFAILAVAFVAPAIPKYAAVDVAISVALNKLVGLSPLTDKALVQIADSNLIGSLVVALIWLCWFRFVGKPKRIRICVGMLATTGAGIVSRLLQLFLKFHLRPVFDTSLNLTLASGVRPEGLHAWSSFPSDTLTLLGALTCVIVLCDLRLGLVAFVLSAILAFARVATGVHWASDVVFGFLLGMSTVWFASKIPLPKFVYAVDLESPWFAFCAFLLSFQSASFYYSIQMAVKLIVPSITPQ